jgi:hypothetical protein
MQPATHAAETGCLPRRGSIGGMIRARTIAEVESDIIALRAAAERAGTALACLFSTSDEFEAAVVRVRREQGAYAPMRHDRHPLRALALTALLTVAFLLV